jgi:hypothetical protein
MLGWARTDSVQESEVLKTDITASIADGMKYLMSNEIPWDSFRSGSDSMVGKLYRKLRAWLLQFYIALYL